MLIRTEQTPNPATRKFLPGQTVMEAGTRDFPDADSAAASPLASALFDSGMVEGVFFGRDFISVTAADGVSLDRPRAAGARNPARPFRQRRALVRCRERRRRSMSTPTPAIDEDPADADIIDQIKELIETRVRPAVAQDGGDIVYRGYKDGTLYLAHAGRLRRLPVVRRSRSSAGSRA